MAASVLRESPLYPSTRFFFALSWPSPSLTLEDGRTVNHYYSTLADAHVHHDRFRKDKFFVTQADEPCLSDAHWHSESFWQDHHESLFIRFASHHTPFYSTQKLCQSWKLFWKDRLSDVSYFNVS